jgi:hypothetical protein
MRWRPDVAGAARHGGTQIITSHNLKKHFISLQHIWLVAYRRINTKNYISPLVHSHWMSPFAALIYIGLMSNLEHLK